MTTNATTGGDRPAHPQATSTRPARRTVFSLRLTIYPVITGPDPRGADLFQGAADFDLELTESRTLDGHTQELVYRPTPHV